MALIQQDNADVDAPFAFGLDADGNQMPLFGVAAVVSMASGAQLNVPFAFGIDALGRQVPMIGIHPDSAVGVGDGEEVPGPRGFSAYEVAVQQGYDGSAYSWTQSLIGPRGEAGPAGRDGIDGLDGAQGPKGDTGAQGPEGPAGALGQRGYTGADGLQGPAGADSTVPGPKGDTGATGPKGDTGAAGASGLLGEYTVAGRPNAATVGVGKRIIIPELRYVTMYSDGAKWKIPGGCPITLAELDADFVFSGATEVVALRARIPAGLSLDGAIIRIAFDGTKTGSADSLQMRYRVGPLGTIADPLVKQMNPWGGTTYSGGITVELVRLSATSVTWRGGGNGATLFPMGSASGTPYVTPVAVSDFDANSNYVDLCFLPTGGTDSFTIKRGARIELVSIGS